MGIQRAPQTLRFPDGFAQRLHHTVMRFMQRTAFRRQPLDGLAYARG